MGKDPSFPFYASDWLGSNKRARMTLEQQGAYINLLARQWTDPACSLPDDDGALGRLSEVGETWRNGGYQVVKECFPPHPFLRGRLANTRLLELRAERDAWIEKSRKGGQASAVKRWGHKRLGAGNQSVTKGVTKGQPIGNSPSPSPHARKLRFLVEDMETAEWMHGLNLELNPETKQPSFEAWANDVRLMREADKRSDEQIRALYQWCHGDSFWQANVLCPSKLRAKWDQLQVKRSTSHAPTRIGPGQRHRTEGYGKPGTF